MRISREEIRGEALHTRGRQQQHDVGIKTAISITGGSFVQSPIMPTSKVTYENQNSQMNISG